MQALPKYLEQRTTPKTSPGPVGPPAVIDYVFQSGRMGAMSIINLIWKNFVECAISHMSIVVQLHPCQ